MRQLEGVERCRNCVSREFVTNRGLVCKLTNNNPAFEDECSDFCLDETLTEIAPIPEEEVLDFEQSMDILLKEQNLPLGILFGLVAAVAGAILWGMISVSTGYQIGYMAIGMGFLVGYAVRKGGKGVTQIFGIAGAALALLGCILGDVFSLVGFAAKYHEVSYMDMLLGVDYSVLFSSLIDNLLSMTIVFYILAVIEGYKLSFRNHSPQGGKI